MVGENWYNNQTVQGNATIHTISGLREGEPDLQSKEDLYEDDQTHISQAHMIGKPNQDGSMYHENRIKLMKKHSKEEGDNDDKKDSAH
jgi:hypothetical protein